VLNPPIQIKRFLGRRPIQPSIDRNLQDHIAELISCEKEFIGIMHWETEHKRSPKYSLRASIRPSIDTSHRLSLVMDADTQSMKQRGSLVLICDNIPIERMEHANRHPHTNPLFTWVPSALRGLEIPADLPRYYAWENNRRLGWPEAGTRNLPVCEIVLPATGSFMESVNYFLKRMNIIGSVPPLEFDARFDLQ